MIGVPVPTLACAMMPPPKIECSATRPSVTSTTSVRTPEPVFTASRPATSLPSAVAETSTAAGAFSFTSWASRAAFGATT
jgi:hypothetical protein